MAQTVIGLFDDNSEARRVADDLMKNGFSQSEVMVNRGNESSAAQQMMTEARIPSQDMNFYAEGMRQGGTLVAVRTEGRKAQQAAEIMGRYNMVDVDARLAQYAQAGSNNVGLSTLDDQGNVLEVIEEEIQVGKRQVQRGGVRIHTHVTERPVEEQVTLRDETVRVERRPVSRDASAADLDSFKEQTIDMTETDEEAVVSKRARVIEEVVVGKQTSEHTETIRDTVRRRDVDVEQLQGSQQAVGAATSDYRSFYDTNYASTGNDYDYYQPVFKYGSSMAASEEYRGKDWNTVETDVRSRWEERNPGTWEEFKGGIRHAWDQATKKR